MEENNKDQAYTNPDINLDVSQRLEVVGQLISGIAHEINTPVQYIGDNIRYVSEELDKLIELVERYRNLGNFIRADDTLRERFREVQSFSESNDIEYLIDDVPSALDETITGIETIAAIVGSLKALVHPGGKEKIETDVNECINTVVTVSRGEWKQCAELQLSLGENLPKVMCYPGELTQVLLNLVINAAHAVSDKDSMGTINISSFVYKNSVGIQVEDSGTGIPLDIQHRIFDPFFTSKDVGKGTGQGLSFAHKSIVERSNGTLFFETSVGEGTTFHIYLPVAE